MADPGSEEGPFERFTETVSSFYVSAAAHRNRSANLDILARDVAALESRGAAVLSALGVERPAPGADPFAGLPGPHAEQVLVSTIEAPVGFLEALRAASDLREFLEPKVREPYAYRPLDAWQKGARSELDQTRGLALAGSPDLRGMPARLSALVGEHGQLLELWKAEAVKLEAERAVSEAALASARTREETSRRRYGSARAEFAKSAGKSGCLGLAIGLVVGLIVQQAMSSPAMGWLGMAATVGLFIAVQYAKVKSELESRRIGLEAAHAEVSRLDTARSELESAISEHRRVRPPELPKPAPEIPGLGGNIITPWAR